MALIKTPEEIVKLRQGGELLSAVLREIRGKCVPGASSAELDALARSRFREAGAIPSFLNYQIDEHSPGFPGALCVSINDEVVHGLPIPDRIIKDGDVVGLDIGVWFEGLCTDMATTVIAGEGNEAKKQLLLQARESLVQGLSVIKAGNFIHQVGEVIEDYLKPKGYGIVRDLVGHGVGHAVHEDPQIPNYRESQTKRTKMRTGMVLAIEPMVTTGGWQVYQKADNWTIATVDKSTVAHFEVTVAVTDEGYELLTPWPDR